ncbi:MAG: IS1380 family transposase [Acidobacteria bacterium]|nr:IS1380 family transposase [Acidobacteriota bacterium]
MQTECTQSSFPFHPLNRREVVARFDGGMITSDGGGLLLREVESLTGILEQFAGCFTDHRDPTLIEHTVKELVSQRVYALALGYEDLNDHDDLRGDPLLATLVGKSDPNGEKRVRERDCGKALAGKSTLNRLELTKAQAGPAERYKKVVVDGDAVERLFVGQFIQAHAQAPERIVLDLDATDDPLHGKQEGRFFHGFYGNYCYLPLYIFCGEFLLCARLRKADIDGAAGSVEELERIVGQIRQSWPEVKIVIRADSGFAREEIMAWCDGNGVGYVLGLARNARLTRALGRELEEAKREHERTGKAARVFKDFTYRTKKSWSRERRVVGKAEHVSGKANPRFVVTSLSASDVDARALYEDEYCARGEMENRIKEQQLYLFADRTSAATMRANQTRLWFSSVAYVLMQALRRVGLAGTTMARAQCETIRLKLLKIGAQVRVTVRKVWVSLASGSPYAALFAQVYKNLRAAPPLRC